MSRWSVGIPPRWEGDGYLWREHEPAAPEPEPQPCALCEREPRVEGRWECAACAADVDLHDRTRRERGVCHACNSCRAEAERDALLEALAARAQV